MLKVFVTEGRTFLLKFQRLGSLYNSYGSKMLYSRSGKSSQKPTEVEKETEASSESTMYTSKTVPDKSFSELVELLKTHAKTLQNSKLSQISLKARQNSKNSSIRIRKFNTISRIGSMLKLKTSPETSLGSESDTGTQTNSESDTSTQTSLGSESKTSTQTSLGSESKTSTQTSLRSESDTLNQPNLGSESVTYTQTKLESKTSTQTSLCSESDTFTKTSLSSESEEIPVLKVEIVPDHPGTELEPIETSTELDIHERVPKKIIPKVFSFAALVNENKCLQKLVALQVDLSQVQKKKGVAKYLVACDFEKHIAPHVLFLAKLDVENVGQYLTKNMEIVRTDLAVLESRLNYLKSKGFDSKAISRIVSNSRILLMNTELVDEKLGHLQKLFSLSGKEVREVLIKTPKLLNKPNMLQLIQENKELSKECLGFSHMELKTILLAYPGFFMKSPGQLSKMFDFLHNTMEIDHKTLVKNCHVFKSQLRSIQNRHLYLLKVDRAQYDPQRENFVSFNALVSGTNEEFCTNVAKTSLQDYYKFLECL